MQHKANKKINRINRTYIRLELYTSLKASKSHRNLSIDLHC